MERMRISLVATSAIEHLMGVSTDIDPLFRRFLV